MLPLPMFRPASDLGVREMGAKRLQSRAGILPV